jgi:hypothetical protein
MPLAKSCSIDAYKANIAELIRSGKPKDQAVAIAHDTLRESCKAEGKSVPRTDSVDDFDVVQRFDLSRIGKAKRTPQGFLKFDANITRIGVLEYRKPDGTIQREFRPPDEVFRAESLDSLAGAPLTDLHVPEVTPQNVSSVQRGRVSDSVNHDDRFVKSAVIAQDSSLIEKIDRGERKELSAGYRCRLDFTPGTYNGERYDAIQRDIEYNHVAIGPEGWGRAGGEVAIRLDGNSAISVDTDVSSMIPIQNDGKSAPGGSAGTFSNTGEKGTMKRNLRIDGIDYAFEADDSAFQAFDRWVKKTDENEKKLSEQVAATESRADSNVKAAEASTQELQGRFDAQTKELETVKKDLEDANSPARLDSLVNERVTLISQAREIIGKDDKGTEAKFDGKSIREIKEAVLRKVDPEVKLDGTTEDYVNGMFEYAVKNFRKADGAAGLRQATVVPPNGLDQDRDKAADPRQARLDMIREIEEASTKPLSGQA